LSCWLLPLLPLLVAAADTDRCPKWLLLLLLLVLRRPPAETWACSRLLRLHLRDKCTSAGLRALLHRSLQASCPGCQCCCSMSRWFRLF
jgi:hypothetical protein